MDANISFGKVRYIDIILTILVFIFIVLGFQGYVMVATDIIYKP